MWLPICFCFLLSATKEMYLSVPLKAITLFQVRSDRDSKNRVKYSLSGIGADQPPLNLFIVNQETGYVTVTGILDREEYHQFNVCVLLCF